MNNLEKIQAVLTEKEIRIIKTDLEFVKDEFNNQNINSNSYKQVYEMISYRSHKLSEIAWKLSYKMGITILPSNIIETLFM